MKIEPERIRRLHYGYFVAPDGSPDAGQFTHEPDAADLGHPQRQ